MNEREQMPLLPEVEETDLLELAVLEMLDPTYKNLWKQFAASNRTLAREVIKRAYFATLDTHEITSMEAHHRMINMVTFALSALRLAAQRKRKVEMTDGQATITELPKTTTSSDGDDGEDPPLSA